MGRCKKSAMLATTIVIGIGPFCGALASDDASLAKDLAAAAGASTLSTAAGAAPGALVDYAPDIATDLAQKNGLMNQVLYAGFSEPMTRAGAEATAALRFGGPLVDGGAGLYKIHKAEQVGDGIGVVRESTATAVKMGLGTVVVYGLAALGCTATAPACLAAGLVGGVAVSVVGDKSGDVVAASLEARIAEIEGQAGHLGPAARPGTGRAQRGQSGGLTIGDASISATIESSTVIARGRNARAGVSAGVVTGDRGEARVSGGNLSATAGNESTASVQVGVAGEGARVDARVRDVVANAQNGSVARVNIAVAENGGRARADVRGHAVSSARNYGTAVTSIASANGGSASATVPNVTTLADRGVALTVIAENDGGHSSVHLGGDVMTIANGGSATTEIGTVGSVTSRYEIINRGGNLGIAAGGRISRHGMTCLTVHRRLCVVSIVPQYKGNCPPRYVRARGQCFLYSDRRHQLG